MTSFAASPALFPPNGLYILVFFSLLASVYIWYLRVVSLIFWLHFFFVHCEQFSISGYGWYDMSKVIDLDFHAYNRCDGSECLLRRAHLIFLFSFWQFLQVWSLESRSLVCSLQWESNITAFSVISGSHFMYVRQIFKFSTTVYASSCR